MKEKEQEKKNILLFQRCKQKGKENKEKKIEIKKAKSFKISKIKVEADKNNQTTSAG